MTRTLASSAAALAVLALTAVPALAQEQPRAQVAGAFMAAAQAQDRAAVLRLLDEKVSIQFPVRARGAGHAEGQPFVIGYLDGLLGRTVSVDRDRLHAGDAVHFLARDARTHDLYAIDVEVREEHVTKVTVTLETADLADQTVTSLGAS